MSVPKHKKTKSKTRMGRSHEAIKVGKPNLCSKCKSPVLSHRACPECGFYKGRQVIRSKADLVLKRDDKQKKKEQKDKERMAKLKNK